MPESLPIQPGNWSSLNDYLTQIIPIPPIPGSPYQQQATKHGNYTDDPNPFGFVGHGPGGYVFGPLVVDQTFGRSNPNANVPNTTQAVFIYARYYGPVVDDSAEAASAVSVLVDTGTPFTQTLNTVGFEGISIAQGGNIVSNKLIGTIGTVTAQNTSQVANAIAFYVSTLSGAVSAGATITNFYGLYQETPTATGTITNKWGAWFKDRVQVEAKGTPSAFGTAAASGLPSSTLYVQGDSGNGVGDLIVQQGAGQTTAQLALRTSGGAVRLQMFGASGNVLLGNGATGGGGAGITSMVTTTAPTGTAPVAAGAYDYVDPADNSRKVRTHSGHVTTIGPDTATTISGSRSANAALASLLTALAGYGLIVDSTTA